MSADFCGLVGILPRRASRRCDALRSKAFSRQWRRPVSSGGFGGGLFDVRVTVDHLQVRPAPEVEELGPRQVAMLAPDSEQWRAVVNLGSLPQSSAAGRAAPALQLPQELGVVARSVPQMPRNHTGGVPNGVFV